MPFQYAAGSDQVEVTWRVASHKLRKVVAQQISPDLQDDEPAEIHHLSQVHNDMSAFMSKYKKARLHKLHKDESLGKPADQQVARVAISISKSKVHRRDASPTPRRRSKEHLPRIF